MDLAIACLLAFLIGSLPFGYWMGRAKGIDVRKIGSGNIGATNVSRALGPKLGLVAFALDVFKGAIPAAGALLYFHRQDLAFYIGLVAVTGHCLSPFLGFKGGKGVATGLGMLIGSSPLVAAITFAIFLVFFVATRYVSLSSLIASGMLIPEAFYFRYPPALLGGYIGLALFIFYRHRGNISRLAKGTEPKFSFKGPAPGPNESDKSDKTDRTDSSNPVEQDQESDVR